jgi:hypothetical protein
MCLQCRQITERDVLSYISISMIFKYSCELQFELNAAMDCPAACCEGGMAECIIILNCCYG